MNTMWVRYRDEYVNLPITKQEYKQMMMHSESYKFDGSYYTPQEEIVEERIRKFRWDENKQLLINRGKGKKPTHDELIKRVFDSWDEDTKLFGDIEI